MTGTFRSAGHLAEVEFTTVTVNEHGQICEHQRHRARQFVEQLDDVELELVWLPGGTFLMGSLNGQGYDDERPQHRVTVAPLLIGRYPVTQEQWQAVMDQNPARFRGPRRPVENVSWLEATRFCQRLLARTGRRYHLPSEAQWEYACRAGTSTAFSYGPSLTTEVANYNGEFVYGAGPEGVYRHETTEAGSFPPNAFGLFDLHGNVWEWCADVWHDSYQGAPTDERTWSSGGETECRVARGGCWHDTPDVCRSAARLRLRAQEGDEFVGFRVSLLPILS